jgi:uncharacterized protein YbcI
MTGEDPTTQADAPVTNDARNSSELVRVTRGLVRIYKEQFGRGPERAATHYAGPDTIVCLLYESLTPVEQSMRKMGEDQRLRDVRTLFQYATEDQFRAAVEEATGRRVTGFMSGIDIYQDVACELFTLEPR